MTPADMAKLVLKIRSINVGCRKIDGYIFKTFAIVLANFQVNDKLGRSRFFQKTFLLANTSMELVLGMLFFTFSNADMFFAERNFT